MPPAGGILTRRSRGSCRIAAQGGCHLAIHPAQVPVINAAFTPDADQIDWARRAIAALDGAGEGVAVLDGRMIDRPHRRSAERILRAAGA